LDRGYLFIQMLFLLVSATQIRALGGGGTLKGRDTLPAQGLEGISATLVVAIKEQEAEVAEAEVAHRDTAARPRGHHCVGVGRRKIREANVVVTTPSEGNANSLKPPEATDRRVRSIDYSSRHDAALPPTLILSRGREGRHHAL
jgi:hypothetical protein